MATYTASVVWQREGDAAFTDQRYSRAHAWRFDGGVEVPASSSPHSVPLPMSVERAVDPEEAFVAALSSCHMLWFLSLAAKRGLVVERYEDEASGTLARTEQGRTAFREVVLRPRVRWATAVSREAEGALHHEAHEQCYLANSVRCEVRVEPA